LLPRKQVVVRTAKALLRPGHQSQDKFGNCLAGPWAGRISSSGADGLLFAFLLFAVLLLQIFNRPANLVITHLFFRASS
jgi:hypothetical protein